MSIEITVRFVAGAYVTNTVGGKRASSTMSAKAAAERLGEKHFGSAFQGAELRSHDQVTQIERWVLKGGR